MHPKDLIKKLFPRGIPPTHIDVALEVYLLAVQEQEQRQEPRADRTAQAQATPPPSPPLPSPPQRPLRKTQRSAQRQATVVAYAKTHPKATPKGIARACCLHYTTVMKYLREAGLREKHPPRKSRAELNAQILEALETGPATVAELAEALELPKNHVSTALSYLYRTRDVLNRKRVSAPATPIRFRYSLKEKGT